MMAIWDRALSWPSLLLQVLLLAPCWAGAQCTRWSGKGTTPHLRSIFLGRCGEYIDLLQPQLRDKNCTAMWEAFQLALNKDPCSVLPSDYDRFIDLARHPIPRDKALIWENNQLLVVDYSEKSRRYMPLGDALFGKVVDFMSWCRQENGSGLDYQSCPVLEDCETNAMDSFWRRASTQYAKETSGVIHVMLNGSEPKGAYPAKGFLANYEIPNLQKDKVTRVEIWVMHDIGGPYLESCGEGTVKIMEDKLKEMGLQYRCTNDYLPVKLFMCVDHTTHPDCDFTSDC